MKLKVLRHFVDKYNGTDYQPGKILDWEDTQRIEDCVARGLAALCSDSDTEAMDTEAQGEQEKPKARKKKTS